LSKAFNKILIIQTAFLGDVVLATPIIEKLHQFYPAATIDFLLRKGNESLLKNHPYLRHTFILDKKHKFKSAWHHIKLIRQEKYDLVINVQRFATSGLITALSGAKLTVGFDKNPFSFLFSKRKPHIIGGEDQTNHEVDRNISLISDITDKERVRPKLYVSDADFKKAGQYKTNEYVCIAPTSVWFTKQFPASKWVELIKKIPEQIHVYLLGAPGDFDACEHIKNECKGKNVSNLAGHLSLLESSALMKDAILTYVNDSAPMHLATQINAPVCAVYCSTIPGFGFGPLSDFSRIAEVTEALPCRPCNLHGYRQCPQGHFKCADIPVTTLLEFFNEAAGEKNVEF
jgi:lipopolysaccharide heptosyltransferase II